MTVLFLHIPKSAGTSYGFALRDALGEPSLVVDIPGEVTSEEFQQQVDPESLRRYSFVMAHVDYGLCRRAPFLRPVTVLRDPVDRIVSWYHYVLRSTDSGLAAWRRLLEGRGMSIEEFLLHPQLRWSQGQAQTLQVAGYTWSGEPYPFVDDIIGEAEANLSQFAHVGLYERLGDSLRLAQAELGLATVPSLPDANVSPPPASELDPQVRAEVADILGMDATFYPWAVEEFERRLAAHGLAGDPTELAPPARPPAVEVRAPAANPAVLDAPDPGQVGDWVELAWFPDVGAEIGGPLAWSLPLAAPADGAVVDQRGESFVLGDEAPLDLALGANWVRLAAGLYHVQATVPCRRIGVAGQDVPWDLLFDFAWYGSPPIPYVPGVPGAPDVVLWRPQVVPPGLPPLPLRGAPVSAGGLLRVPEGGGHLCLLLGSSHPVVISPGDEVRLHYARVG